MAAYIVRRLLLIIPTLLGIMLLNFGIIQFAPGGPVERILMELEDGEHGAGATARFSGGGGESTGAATSTGEGAYRGRVGIDEELIADLEAQLGFARIVCAEGFTGEPDLDAEECVAEEIPILERFGLMMMAGAGLTVSGLFMIANGIKPAIGLGAVVLGILLIQTEPLRLQIREGQRMVVACRDSGAAALESARDRLRTGHLSLAATNMVLLVGLVAGLAAFR